MENLLKRRFFYDQSFSIYGGVNGLYDYGPVGCAIKANIISLWRRHFILEEQMLEIDCSILTPEIVLKASGHVDRFADSMLKDTQTGECFRADHLIEDHLEKLLEVKDISDEKKAEIQRILPQIGNMNVKDLQKLLEQYNIKSPNTNNDLSEPIAFNLMFSTSIGPTSQMKGYLRPETAQGMFVNFKRLLEFNQGRLPFAAAQIGNSFRNEISPRSGVLRVREFTMAEIEHFVDPIDKTHSKFETIADLEVQLYSAINQINGESAQLIRLDDAVRLKLINNETLAYFIGRIYLFLIKTGIDKNRIRFRQHMNNEMSHYACDCWDAECKISYGWIECVGCADRSCYDLTQHIKFSSQRLVAERSLSTPKQIQISEKRLNHKMIGQLFRKDASIILEYLQNLSENEAQTLHKKLQQSDEKLTIDNKEFNITKSIFTLETIEKTVQVEEFIPSVIEPTFGFGRIMYTTLEHNFKIRPQDDQRKYFTLPPLIAPYKCAVLPLSANAEFKPFVKQISDLLTQIGISYRVDTCSRGIGKRYARCDEIAISFAITIDFDTLSQPHSIVLRELNSLQQIRIKIDEIACVLQNLSTEKVTWDEISTIYPTFTEQKTKRLEDKREDEMKTINEKLSEINSNCKTIKSEEVDEQNMSYQGEYTRERRNAFVDASTVWKNANASCPKHYYNQLAERIRELEKDIVPDLHFYQVPPAYSPFSAITPCSNASGFGFSNYPYTHNFPFNLISPNSSVPTQPFGLSSKILERAYEIPERFWIDWQERQMQNRIEELENIKNKCISPSKVDSTISNQQKDHLLRHNAQHHISPPQSAAFDTIISTNDDNKISSSTSDNNCSFNFDQRSIDKVNRDNLQDMNTSSPMKSITSTPCLRKSQSTLDRSRLTIFLPYSFTNIPEQTMSSANSIEDVAQIDTELNLILILRENRDQTNSLLFSKVIIDRTIEFQSLSSSSSKKESSTCQRKNIN
ncbi:unnamed protein product [Rotaria sp. Silwood1]|nr:unnamed protein product [Rotaria sp. Silwood1]